MWLRFTTYFPIFLFILFVYAVKNRSKEEETTKAMDRTLHRFVYGRNILPFISVQTGCIHIWRNVCKNILYSSNHQQSINKIVCRNQFDDSWTATICTKTFKENGLTWVLTEFIITHLPSLLCFPNDCILIMEHWKGEITWKREYSSSSIVYDHCS